jgi:hypothetical protein
MANKQEIRGQMPSQKRRKAPDRFADLDMPAYLAPELEQKRGERLQFGPSAVIFDATPQQG